MRADIGEPRLDVGDPVRIARRLGLGEQARAFLVGGEDEIDQRRRARPALPARRGRAGHLARQRECRRSPARCRRRSCGRGWSFRRRCGRRNRRARGRAGPPSPCRTAGAARAGRLCRRDGALPRFWPSTAAMASASRGSRASRPVDAQPRCDFLRRVQARAHKRRIGVFDRGQTPPWALSPASRHGTAGLEHIGY